jgi:hypothetical protein
MLKDLRRSDDSAEQDCSDGEFPKQSASSRMNYSYKGARNAIHQPHGYGVMHFQNWKWNALIISFKHFNF